MHFVFFFSSILCAHAQESILTQKYNSETLWMSYDHNAFQIDLKNRLGINDKNLDAFQKYLILIKKTWKDEEVFFTKAQKGIINESNKDAFFEQLKNKYFDYYPSFLVYTDSLNIAMKEHAFLGTGMNPAPTACGQTFTNEGFETNDFTGWNQLEGSSVSGSGISGVSMTPGTTQSSITSAGFDAIVGTPLPTVNPAGGGAHSAMVGNGPVTGAQAGELSTSFTVSASMTNFTYAYAVVLEDPGHPVSDQPYFFQAFTDQGGNLISCGNYSVTAGPGLPNFTQIPGTDLYYRQWTTVSIDLTSYVGQCVTLTFICRDCDQGGHYGYAYVDCAFAKPMLNTATPVICGSNSNTLTASPGAVSYSWTGPGIVGASNTQSISVNAAGSYEVIVTNAGGCSYKIDTTLLAGSSPSVTLTQTNASCSPGGDGTANASGTGGNLPYTYSWYPAPSGGQGTANATGLNPDVYTVTLTAANGCPTTGTATISNPPGGLSLNMNNIVPASCSNCTDGSATIAITGGTLPYAYSWTPAVPTGQGTNHVTGLSTGKYTCCVSDGAGCRVCDSVTISFATGIQTQRNSRGFSISPNPFNLSLNIQVPDSYIKAELVLYTIQGQEIIHQRISSESAELNTSAISPGIYFLSLKSDEGSLVRKIIRE